MHAVFVTFSTSVATQHLHEDLRSYAVAIRDEPGFISKTWIVDSRTVGGFHVFATATDADGFLIGEVFGGLRRDDRFSAFEVRRFDVLEELSGLTGGASAPP